MKRLILLLSLLSITLFGCQVELSTPAQVSNISFSENEITLKQDEVKTVSVKATDNRSLHNLKLTTSPSDQENVQLQLLANNQVTIKALKKGTVNVKVTEENTGKTASIKITVNEKAKPPVTNIFFSESEINLKENEEKTVVVKATNDRTLSNLNFTTTPTIQDYIKISKKENNQLTIKALKKGSVSVKVTEENTGKTAKLNVTINEKAATSNPNGPKVVVSVNNNTSSLIPSVLEINEDYIIDVRIVENNMAQSISDFTYNAEPNIDGFITTEQSTWSYKVTLHADKLNLNQEVKVSFTPSFGPTDYPSDVYTIRKVKDVKPNPPAPIVPDTKPDSGEGQKPTDKPDNKPLVIQYNTQPNPKLKNFEPYIIKHDYANEKVYWLGGIEEPKESDFEDYKSIGQEIEELDEQGNVIGHIKSDIEVPKFYVKDTNKENESGKPSWYNVNKSFSKAAPDSAMCWAMASAGALHWWFDSLGEEYKDKLFYVRRNRKDMTSPSVKMIFDDLHGDDTHYIPLEGQGDVETLAKRSGIGAYAIKSFDNIGGNPIDLFRLYFLGEDGNRFNSNYKKGRSLGLLHGMGWMWNGGNIKDGNDDKLWEYQPMVDRSRNELVNEFKRAINEGVAIVLSQANIPDTAISEEDNGTKAAHAIVVWGVIFDESLQNVVGLYVGDNNLKESKLARVDLVYKQLREVNGQQSGRYYYGAPYVSQTSSSYVKATSVYGLSKLLPPTQDIRNWIDDEAAKLNYPNK